MRTRSIWIAVGLALCAGCRPGGDSARIGTTNTPGLPPEGSAVVFGTVLDLKSGEPAAEVEITAPEGKSARTDQAGRFEIAGLRVGTRGEVRALAADGRQAVNQLLPLGHERREIVLYLEAR